MGRLGNVHGRRVAAVAAAGVLALSAVAGHASWSHAHIEEGLSSTNPLTTAVNVSPSDNLPNSAQVNVSGRGFHPDAEASLLQCTPVLFPSPASADCQRRGSARTNGSGSFGAVQVTVNVNMGGSVQCRLLTTCGLFAVTQPPGEAHRMAGHHLTFQPSLPLPVPVPPPTGTPTPPTTPPTAPPTTPPSPSPQPGTPGAPAPPGPAAPGSPAAPGPPGLQPPPGGGSPTVVSRTAPVEGTGQPAGSPSSGQPQAGGSGPKPGAPPDPVGTQIGGVVGAAPFATDAGQAAPGDGPGDGERARRVPIANVRPTNVKPGQKVTISGNGFGANESLEISFGSPSARLTDTRSDDLGTYRRVVTIPDDASLGNHEMAVSAPDGTRAVTTVKVVPAPASRRSVASSLLASPWLPAVIAALLLALSRLWRRRQRSRLLAWQ